MSQTFKTDFQLWKRQYSDDVVFATGLRPLGKIVALGILNYVNKNTRSTYVDLLTIAKRIGIKYRKVRKEADCLVAEGRLRITPRPGATPLLEPQVRGDAVFRASRGDKSFYRERGKLLDRLIFDCSLTPGERLVGIGTVAFAEPLGGK